LFIINNLINLKNKNKNKNNFNRCDSCVEQLFYRGSGSCPNCGQQLKKSDFREQVFDDTYIEKEIVVRKKLLKEYRKKNIV
jgi:predicted amidophosphoribosyltransferase